MIRMKSLEQSIQRNLQENIIAIDKIKKQLARQANLFREEGESMGRDLPRQRDMMRKNLNNARDKIEKELLDAKKLPQTKFIFPESS